MDWLQALDVAGFRFVNLTLSNPLFDWALPFFSWNSLFVPGIIVMAAGLLWKGGTRGRLFLLLLALVVLAGDALIVNSLKQAFGRPRPFHAIADANVLVGRGGSGSMPSGHTANWFAATAIAFIYYRASLWFLLPLASLIAFSRVYLGVHYPSDVVAGAVLGVVYAAGMAWSLNALWQSLGRRWFPLWWRKLPSLLEPRAETGSTDNVSPDSRAGQSASGLNQHWLRLGYVLILILFVARLAYLAGGTIELSEDEAYQWLWSKHPALSYFSKPPLIAYTQFLGTALWGDSAFGVRFFSPVLAASLSLLLLRFLAREVNPRVGLWVLLLVTVTPLTAVGAILLTIDPLSVLFWTAAMCSGWKAVRQDSTRQWLWTGLWMGLGFLSKYTALFQFLSWAVFFVLWKPARAQLLRPGPYLALCLTAICTIPVLLWNHENGWITVTHLANRAGLDQAWKPTARFLGEFVGAELALLNPFFAIPMVWTAAAFWRQRDRTGLMTLFFSMGAPLFLFYFFYTLRARVQPNWIVPSVLPLFCLLAVYWEERWRERKRFIRPWLTLGVVFGTIAVVLLLDTNLVQKIAGTPLPAGLDPSKRVRGWSELARVVGAARTGLLREGKPVFIIGSHYGITGLLSFYLPEAKAGVPDNPLVYYQFSDHPENQFYFWPGYQARKGQNAIYVQRNETPQPPPERITKAFGTVSDLGVHEILYRGRVFHRVQLYACRDLR